MTISLLRELVDLAYTLNFGETATRMHISQSTLSKHISSIEDELGAKIFERTRQYVKTTEKGAEFCARMKELILLYDDASHALRNSSEDLVGALRVGFLDAAVHDLLRQSIRPFKEKFPGISLLLSNGELGDIERELQQNNLDMCISILFQNSVLAPNMQFTKLYEDVVAAVIPSDNPLSKRQQVRFYELLDYPVGLPSPHQYPPFASLIQNLVEESGKTPDVVCEFTHVNTAMLLAESATAITFLPAHLCQYPHSTQFVPLSDPETAFQVGAFWLRNNHAKGLAPFIEDVRATAQQMQLPPR